jgi:hypothetical protein
MNAQFTRIDESSDKNATKRQMAIAGDREPKTAIWIPRDSSLCMTHYFQISATEIAKIRDGMKPLLLDLLLSLTSVAYQILPADCGSPST